MTGLANEIKRRWGGKDDPKILRTKDPAFMWVHIPHSGRALPLALLQWASHFHTSLHVCNLAASTAQTQLFPSLLAHSYFIPELSLNVTLPVKPCLKIYEESNPPSSRPPWHPYLYSIWHVAVVPYLSVLSLSHSLYSSQHPQWYIVGI